MGTPPEPILNTGAREEAVAVADFDGDGRDDVAVATGGGGTVAADDSVKIFVFTQTAAGTLGAPVKLSSDTSPTDSRVPLVAADLDGDGDADLARGTAGGLDVHWNDGSGLTDSVLYLAGGAVTAIQAADLDTGAVELAVEGAGGSSSRRVLRWTGTTFSSQTVFSAPPSGPSGITVRRRRPHP